MHDNPKSELEAYVFKSDVCVASLKSQIRHRIRSLNITSYGNADFFFRRSFLTGQIVARMLAGFIRSSTTCVPVFDSPKMR